MDLFQTFVFVTKTGQEFVDSQHTGDVQFITDANTCHSTQQKHSDTLQHIETRRLHHFDRNNHDWQSAPIDECRREFCIKFSAQKHFSRATEINFGLYAATTTFETPSGSLKAELHINGASIPLGPLIELSGQRYYVVFDLPQTEVSGPWFVIFRDQGDGCEIARPIIKAIACYPCRTNKKRCTRIDSNNCTACTSKGVACSGKLLNSQWSEYELNAINEFQVDGDYNKLRERISTRSEKSLQCKLTELKCTRSIEPLYKEFSALIKSDPKINTKGIRNRFPSLSDKEIRKKMKTVKRHIDWVKQIQSGKSLEAIADRV